MINAVEIERDEGIRYITLLVGLLPLLGRRDKLVTPRNTWRWLQELFQKHYAARH
jgi:hypothetical protein